MTYQNQPVRLQTRDFAGPQERSAYYESQPPAELFPSQRYGFFGRDLDILEIERRLLGCLPGESNLLLLHGMGGAGKTTLLLHLAAWWQNTGLVGQAFYFAYDQKAWGLQEIQHTIAKGLLGEARYQAEFVPISEKAQG